jgi:hypothetical protein
MDSSQSVFNINGYLESNTQAASRVRGVLGLLVTICVLTFAGYLNSYKYGWMNSRLKDNFSYDTWRVYIANKFSNDDSMLRQLSVKYDSSKQEFAALQENDTAKRKINETEWGEFRSSYFRSYIDNALYVRMPFFGIAFDVNYLNLMSSIALIIVYILLYLSLNSEQSNLTLAFRAIKFQMDKWIFAYLEDKETLKTIDTMVAEIKTSDDFKGKYNTFHSMTGKDLFKEEPQDIIKMIVANYRSKKTIERKRLIATYREIRRHSFLKFHKTVPGEGLAEMDNFYNFYRLIASRQVFVLPFIEGIEKNQNKIFEIASKLIPIIFCFLPVIILGVIIKHDIETSGIGNVLNHHLYNSSLLINIALGIVVLLLGISCFKRYTKIDELWDEKWEEIKYYKSYLFFLTKETYLKTYPYPKFLK